MARMAWMLITVWTCAACNARSLPPAPPTAIPTRKATAPALPTVRLTARPTATLTAIAVTSTAASVTATVSATLAASTATPVAAAATPTAIVVLTQTIASQPATMPEKIALVEWVVGLENPVYLTHAGRPDLLYVVEQPGRIRVIRAGSLLRTPFLDISDHVGSSGNEQGLLSVAFAPDFATSRRLYVDYTDIKGDTVIAGFIADDDFEAQPASEWRVLSIDQPYANHNGGQLQFGPDGMLYIGMGDGGSQGDPNNNAQNLNALLGKLLRIDVSHSTADAPYLVPADNPALAGAHRPEIWALGLRNPWRFSFDRVSGALYIGDVGGSEVEEVDVQAAGLGGVNYGWRVREGTRERNGEREPGMVDPVHEYEHGADGCSITGGYVYRGAALKGWQGAYFYSDYCSGKLWALTQDGAVWTNTLVLSTGYPITSFGEDAQGELYVVARSGEIYQMRASNT